ncbi:MAG: GGDEF domain-containing protein, partial [Anaeroplasmataceae bacterium]|nr:GGDEF domain-containing protein [Anaeroplasmataceae bacterium]
MIRYEIKGAFEEEILTMVFSNIDNISLDSLDSATKVFTRESIIEKTKIQIKNKQPFALVILDVDNFKQFNDTYGHMFGDIILVETAAAIKKILGPNDFVGRIGGDEFLIVIHTPNNSFEEIHKVCSNIKRTIQELSFNNIKQASVTATLGCSVFPSDSENYELLFKKADRALYRGKKKGRNCFVIYTLEKCGEVDELTFKKSFSDIETNDKITTNSQIIVAAFEILTRNNTIKKNLEDVMDLVGNFFSIERIHLEIMNLENEKNICIEWIDSQQSMHKGLIKPTCKNRDLWLEQLDQTGMIKINQVKKQEETPFIKILLEEQAKSLL